MGFALIDIATSKILGWQRWNAPSHDPETQAIVSSEEPPDRETMRWDGAEGLRPVTAQELADVAAEQLAALKAAAKAALSQQRDEVRVALQAIVRLIVAELNILRERDRDRSADVAAATNLANLQTRWAARSSLNDRTGQQAKTAIESLIDEITGE